MTVVVVEVVVVMAGAVGPLHAQGLPVPSLPFVPSELGALH